MPASPVRICSASVIALLLLGPVIPLATHAQPLYDLRWDPALSSEVGAENLVTLRRGLMHLEHQVLPLQWGNEDTWHEKAFGVAYRLSRVVFLERPFTSALHLTQHEVFGHGAAARQTGAFGTTYDIGLPWPYGSGGGRAYYPSEANFHAVEDVYATANGPNSALELARVVRGRAMLRGTLYYDEVALGVSGHFDLPLYILGTDDRTAEGDVATYLRDLPHSSLTLTTLKRRALVSLADPFILLALGSSLRNHFWRGTKTAPLPTIEWRSVRYLPSVHLALSPFGPEVVLEHLAVHGTRLWRVSTRLGDGPYGRFGGAGLDVRNVLRTSRLRTDVRLDVWYQPLRLLSPPVRTTRSRRRPPGRSAPESSPIVDPFAVGGRVEVSASIRPTPDWPVFATGTLGYKTDGFVVGERLDEGVLVEFGLRLDTTVLE